MRNVLNYPEWRDLHRQTLESLRDKSVMMFFSGGKDSSLVLHLLQQAGREFGFSFETHAGIYPHHVFASSDCERLDQYWRKRGIEIRWHEVRESDDRLASALNEGMSPCLVCNAAKKKELVQYMRTSKIDKNSLVIVMSYSLWDLVSASLERILGSVYAIEGVSPALRHKSREERFFETFQRFYPLLRLRNGFSVFKPLIYYNDQDIRRVISEEGIPILSTTCRFRQYRPKRLFAHYYERMNLQFDFNKVLNFAQTALDLPEESYFSQMDEAHYLEQVI